MAFTPSNNHGVEQQRPSPPGATPEPANAASQNTVSSPQQDANVSQMADELADLGYKLSVTGDPIKTFEIPDWSDDEYEPETGKATDGEAEEVEVAEWCDKHQEKPLKDVEKPEANENIRPVLVQKVIVDTLPDELQNRDCDAWLYPPGKAGVYGTLRGADVPKALENFQMPNGQKALKLAPVVFTFWKESSPSEVLGHVGSFRKPDDTVGEPDQRCVRMSWIMHSQIPGVQFTIKRSASRKAGVIIHANSLRRYSQDGETIVGWQMRTAKDPAMRDTLLHPSVMSNPAAKKDKSNPWEIRIGFPLPNKLPTFGPEFRRPEFVFGVTQQELEDMKTAVVTSQCSFGDLNVLSCGDWILYGLYTQYDFSVYRLWPDTTDAIKVFNTFNDWFSTAMRDCAANGNFPHYARQAHKQGKTLKDLDVVHIDSMMPPQHLVKKWTVTREDGKPVDCKAEQWGSYITLDHYPDAETDTLDLYLAGQAGRNTSREALRVLRKSVDDFNKSEIRRYRDADEAYWRSRRRRKMVRENPGKRINY